MTQQTKFIYLFRCVPAHRHDDARRQSAAVRHVSTVAGPCPVRPAQPGPGGRVSIKNKGLSQARSTWTR